VLAFIAPEKADHQLLVDTVSTATLAMAAVGALKYGWIESDEGVIAPTTGETSWQQPQELPAVTVPD